MKTINLRDQLPPWVDFISEHGFHTKDGVSLFMRNRILGTGVEEFYPHINFECSDDCGSRMDVYFDGFDRNSIKKSLDVVFLSHSHKKPEDKEIMIYVDIEKEGVADSFIDFFKTVKEAIIFERDLKKGYCFTFQFSGKGYEIEIIMKKEDDNSVILILSRVNEFFEKIPIVREAKNYKEGIGIIAEMEIGASGIDEINPG